MAEILPFRAWHYNRSRVELSSVVTQPYDKITPEMQEGYYARSPYNLVRIILGKEQAGDDREHNVYTRAAEAFCDWRKQRVLVQDERPAIYSYSQRFTVSGKNEALERRGFIAAGKIYDYDEGVVFRHEQTLAKPKADRMELLRATRAHFGQIFMLYSDREMKLEKLLSSGVEDESAITDEYGVTHVLRPVREPKIIKAVQRQMAEKKLLIADGHHRYETALGYRNERCGQERRQGRCAGAQPAPFEYAMMSFINMDAPGLVILPTHRVLSGMGAERIALLSEKVGEWFDFRQLDCGRPAEAVGELETAGRSGTAFVLALPNKVLLLKAKPEKVQDALSEVRQEERALDVIVLHSLILQKILGLSEESIKKQENISYYREAKDAVARVQGGSADCAFLMNPARMQQVRDVAFAGRVLPQKSTDFYPKMLSGLTIYALD